MGEIMKNKSNEIVDGHIITPSPLTKTFISSIKTISLPDAEGLSLIEFRGNAGSDIYDFKHHALADRLPDFEHAGKDMSKFCDESIDKADKVLFCVALAEFYVNGGDGFKNLESKFNKHELEVLAKAADKAALLRSSKLLSSGSANPLAAKDEEYNIPTLLARKRRGNEILRNHGIEID